MEEGAVGVISADGAPRELPGPFYFGTRGMRSVAEAMLEGHEGIEVVPHCWVNRMRATDAGWELQGEGKDRGVFDICVIAHNGKCANNLLKPSGAPRTYDFFRRLKLSSTWVALVAFHGEEVRLPGGLRAAFSSGLPSLKLAVDQGAKFGGGANTWALLSTAEYAKSNKVPQERVSQADADKVLQDLLEDLRAMAGVDELPPVRYSFCQLWGAALPRNALRGEAGGCTLDVESRVAACGDWIGGGASVENAWRSGQAVAEAIVGLADGRKVGDIGIDGPLVSIEAAAEALGVRAAAAEGANVPA